jgi:hypothetical protein
VIDTFVRSGSSPGVEQEQRHPSPDFLLSRIDSLWLLAPLSSSAHRFVAHMIDLGHCRPYGGDVLICPDSIETVRRGITNVNLVIRG